MLSALMRKKNLVILMEAGNKRHLRRKYVPNPVVSRAARKRGGYLLEVHVHRQRFQRQLGSVHDFCFLYLSIFFSQEEGFKGSRTSYRGVSYVYDSANTSLLSDLAPHRSHPGLPICTVTQCFDTDLVTKESDAACFAVDKASRNNAARLGYSYEEGSRDFDG